MNSTDLTSTLYKSLIEAGMDVKNIQDQITKEIARLNDIKPIHFKNPEKLNGIVHNRGEAIEVTFIGRELSLKEDNWTWIVKEPKSNYEHTLSILKYPKHNGYATMIKNSYGQKTETEINRRDLDKMDFMIQQLCSLTDLPF
jgi:hypothetical protein